MTHRLPRLTHKHAQLRSAPCSSRLSPTTATSGPSHQIALPLLLTATHLVCSVPRCRGESMSAAYAANAADTTAGVAAQGGMGLRYSLTPQQSWTVSCEACA
eukprot:363466-Chlamydomonas_euryale.AAC.14